MTSLSVEKRDQFAIVGLVSTGHFFSHFYVLSLPPVLPLMRAELGVSYFTIGLVMASYAVCSAVFQYPAGALLDRFGARYFVVFGLFFVSLAIALMGFAPSIYVLIALAGLAGTADSQFHPADYAILTARIRKDWLGRSYAIHTFSGFLGFAVAPTLMFLLLANFDWRTSLTIVGCAGMCFAVLLFIQRSRLGQEALSREAVPRPVPKGPKVGVSTFLTSVPIMLMFGFYIATSLSGNGIQTFSNAALSLIYDLDVDFANLGLATYLWGVAAGVLAGGIVADRLHRFDLISFVGYLVAAALLVLIALGVMGFTLVAIGMFFAGFMIGAVMPSRDLMVRSVTPPGATGKAFGFVSTGFGIGGFIGPALYGSIMDSGEPAGVFVVSACLMMVTIAFAVAAGHMARVAAAATQPAE